MGHGPTPDGTRPTFLSFSLEIELEGCVPWRRAALSARAHSEG